MSAHETSITIWYSIFRIKGDLFEASNYTHSRTFINTTHQTIVNPIWHATKVKNKII